MLIRRSRTKPSFNSSIFSQKKSGRTANSIKKGSLIIIFTSNLKLVFKIFDSFFKAVKIINFLIRIILCSDIIIRNIIISFNIKIKKVINIWLRKSNFLRVIKRSAVIGLFSISAESSIKFSSTSLKSSMQTYSSSITSGVECSSWAYWFINSILASCSEHKLLTSDNYFHTTESSKSPRVAC